MTAKKSHAEILDEVISVMEISPTKLAQRIGVRPKDFDELVAEMHDETADMEGDAIWLRIAQLVDDKLARLMALKFEMNRLLQDVRVARATQLERYRAGLERPRLSKRIKDASR